MRAIVTLVTAPTRIPGRVLIAGVPWPLYKLTAIAVGLAALVIVGAATVSVGPAVVAGAAAAAVVWLGLSLFERSDR